jgi:hypothetical protein
MNAKRERGQIMVLVALGLVGLLGFTALALDMGMAYADRRQAQNAADAAALAGARYAGNWLRGNGGVCSGFGDVQKQEIRQTALSGLGNYYPATNTTVSVSNCTASEVVVTVDLAHTVRGAVFQRDTTNMVQAVTRVKTGPMAEGFGLVSLGDSCGNGSGGLQMTFDGGVDVIVNGGGIFSNSCIEVNGNSGTVEAHDGDILYYAGVDDPHNVLNPPAEKVEYQIPIYDIPELPANCDHIPADHRFGAHTGGGSIEYGVYDSISTQNRDDLILGPGLYCITGSLSMNGNIRGNGVTIYLKSGGIDFEGGEKVTLSAPAQDVTTNYGVPGLLIYEDPSNSSELKLTGNSDFSYTGTIYAPNGSVDIGGRNGTTGTLNAQIIAESVTIHGGPTLTINYDESQNYEGLVTADVLH